MELKKTTPDLLEGAPDSKFHIPNSNGGFTLYEMLLAVAVLTLIIGLGAPVYLGFQTRNDVDVAAQVTTAALRRAETLTKGLAQDSPWGVFATTSQIIVFSGSSFVLRNPVYDETTDIAPSLALSGQNETVFAKFTGLPNASGTLIITAINGDARSISINSKGTVSY